MDITCLGSPWSGTARGALLLGGEDAKPRPEELHQVEAGTDQRPFTPSSVQSPSHEAGESKTTFDLTKYRLDGSASKFVGLAALPGQEATFHPLPGSRIPRNPPPWRAVLLAGFPLLPIFLGGYDKLGAVFFHALQIQIVAPASGIGHDGFCRFVNTRLIEGSLCLLNHGLQLMEIVFFLSDSHGDDDLILGNGGLTVVSLNKLALCLHDPAISIAHVGFAIMSEYA